MTKEQVIECIDKIKKVNELMEEVNKKIETCYQKNWQIYGIKYFNDVCKLLDLETTYNIVKDNIVIYTAYYDNIEICCVDNIKGDIRK